MGQIAAFRLDDPFPGDAEQWQWVFGAIGMDRLLWYQRHGMSMGRGNQDFWNFLIPGVGLAPVTEFCILITVFVLAIGPLNYWLLRRWKRLHLLVVTIPVCAAAVTLFLFGYALIADGLSTRVRVRSVTQIDQRRKQAACWARLSYYAGMSPGGGLTFPADTAVLPLEYQPRQGYYPPSTPQRREMVWQADQRLTSGWLAPRTATQYLTLRSRPTDRGLDLIGAEANAVEAKRPLQVRNRLGTHIQQLVVWPDGGQGRYWAENVAADAVATLQPIAPAEAANRLRAVCFANQPVLPDGMAGYRSGIFGVSRRTVTTATATTAAARRFCPLRRRPACWSDRSAAWAAPPARRRTSTCSNRAVTWRLSSARPRSCWATTPRRKRPVFTSSWESGRPSWP